MSERRSLRKRWGEVQSPLALINSMSENSPQSSEPKTPKAQIKKALKKKIRSTMDFEQIDVNNRSLGDRKSLRKSKKKLTKKCDVFDFLPDIDIVTENKKDTPQSKTKKNKSKYETPHRRSFGKNKENEVESSPTWSRQNSGNSESSVEFRIKSDRTTPKTPKSVSKVVVVEDNQEVAGEISGESSKKLSILFVENTNVCESDSVEFRFKDEPVVQSIRKSVRRRRNAPLRRQDSFDYTNSFKEEKMVETVAGSFIENDNSFKLDKTGDTENSFKLKDISNITNIRDVNLSSIEAAVDVLNSSNKSPEEKSDDTYEISPQKSFLRQSLAKDLNNRSTFEVSPSKSVIDHSNFNLSELVDTKTIKTPENNDKMVSLTDITKNTPMFNLRNSQISTPHPKKSILKQQNPILDFSRNDSEIFSTESFSTKKRPTVAFEEPSLSNKKVKKTFPESFKSILRSTNGSERSMGKKKSLRLRESIEIIEDKKEEDCEKSLSSSREDSKLTEHLQKVRLRFHVDEEVPNVSAKNDDLSELSVLNSNRTIGNKSSVSFVGTPHPKNISKNVSQTSKLTLSDNKLNKKPIRTKVPNFALIHQRAFDRMENIKQMQERKVARAQLLLSGHKPDKEKTITVNGEDKKSKKTLHFGLENAKSKTAEIPSVKTPSKANTSLKIKIRASLEKKKQIMKSRIPKLNNKDGVSKFGFKLGQAPVTKKEQIKAVAEKTKVRKDVTEVKRTEVKGVRLNKRFELLMQMRNKK